MMSDQTCGGIVLLGSVIPGWMTIFSAVRRQLLHQRRNALEARIVSQVEFDALIPVGQGDTQRHQEGIDLMQSGNAEMCWRPIDVLDLVHARLLDEAGDGLRTVEDAVDQRT